MLRSLALLVSALLLLVSTAQARPGGDTLLDKKGTLSDKDPGYKPGAGFDKAQGDNADELFRQITNNPHQVFMLKLKKGDKLLIQMKSNAMDCVVVVEDAKKNVLAFNDDDPDAMNSVDSKLIWTVPADDEYRIIATCFENASGDFHLTVEKTK